MSRRRKPSDFMSNNLALILKPLLILSVFFWSLVPIGQALPESSFFEFGVKKNDRLLPNTDDASSEEIQLRVPIAFFDDKYLSLFVSIFDFFFNFLNRRENKSMTVWHFISSIFYACICVALSTVFWFHRKNKK